MGNRLLFKRISECVFYTREKPLISNFSIWSSENFCYEYEDCKLPTDQYIDDDTDIKVILEILKKGKILRKRKLIFKSKKLADEIEIIISKYRDRIDKFPENLHNYGVLDGYTDYLKVERKTIWGGNILSYLPLKRSKYFDNLSPEEQKTEIQLETVSDMYLEIENTITEYRDKIHDFAFSNLFPFKDKESILTFGKKCEELEFVMDSGKKFYKEYPLAYKSETELRNVIENIYDIELLGSAIYSKWRYYTNWALPTEEKPVLWAETLMHHLGSLTIEQFETPSLTKKDILKIDGIPEEYFISEYYETNNLIYLSACKQKELDDFYSFGNAPFLIVRAKWKKENEWFCPNVYVQPAVYLEIKKCKNLANQIETCKPWGKIIKDLLDKENS